MIWSNFGCSEPSGCISAPKRQDFTIRTCDVFNGRQHITDPGSLHNTLVDCMTLLHPQTRRHMICYSESFWNYLHIYFILACGPPVTMCHVSSLSTCICLPCVAYYVRLRCWNKVWKFSVARFLWAGSVWNSSLDASFWQLSHEHWHKSL